MNYETLWLVVLYTPLNVWFESVVFSFSISTLMSIKIHVNVYPNSSVYKLNGS